MSLREKERSKDSQDKFQAILSALLKDEDNKYCVDCDAKGPRWASWNLGIFMCIRCAGIHRNLGVHISKVKSVNLDTWTGEQVAMMQEMGNSRGRAVYEANIPDGFRRPQTDSALESFIRTKYEHKKYIAREFVAPKPTVPKEWLEDSRAEKKRTRAKAAASVQIPSIPKASSKSDPPPDAARQLPPVKADVKVAAQKVAKPAAASNDLLGLEAAAPTPASSGSSELLDLFGGFQSVAPAQPAARATTVSEVTNGASEATNLFGEDSQSSTGEEDKKSAKDSIMALFGGGGGGGGVPQPQVYGVPGGMYMPQGQAFNQQGMSQQGIMAQQPQGQVFNQQGMPQQGMPQQGMPQQGMTQQGMTQQGMTQQGMPQQGMPQQGMMAQQQGMMGNQQSMMGNQQSLMGNQQAMMGNQQNMMGNPQGMMGNQQGMMGNQGGMMGNQQGIMSNPQGMSKPHQGMMGQAQQMNGSQGNMFGTQQPGMYHPQQMQQLQFQQMQQQMASMKMGGPQMGAVPQQAVSGSGWGAQGTGQTLSNNLWQ